MSHKNLSHGKVQAKRKGWLSQRRILAFCRGASTQQTYHMPVDAQTRKCSPTFLWNFLAYGWSSLMHPLNPQQKSFKMKNLTKSSEWETCPGSHLASGVAWITIQRWTLPQLFLDCWHVIMHTHVRWGWGVWQVVTYPLSVLATQHHGEKTTISDSTWWNAWIPFIKAWKYNALVDLPWVTFQLISSTQ